MNRSSSHAVVLGASMGGLIAARVLSDHVDHVTVVERDPLPDSPAQRKGVPQGRHAHGLLAAGGAILEEMFPGLRAALEASGAQSGDLTKTRWIVGGHRLCLTDLGFPGICVARPALESEVRGRVLGLPNVHLKAEHDILGLVHRDRRVVGARVLGRRDASSEETLHADLVVDATGRGSRLPRWLEEAGYQAPREERVRIGVTYSTALFRRKTRHIDGGVGLVVAAAPPNPRAGVALAIGPDTWIVTMVGYLGERCEATYEGMLAFSREMPVLDLHTLVSDSEPISPFSTSTFPFSQRRRYDLLRKHPEGLVAFGDSICSFNPTFGQGMTVAATEGRALATCLRTGTEGLWRRFYRETKPLIDVPWSITVGNDLRFEGVEGERALSMRLLNGYIDRLLAVGSNDAEVGTKFVRVTNLLDPPSALMAPAMVARTIFGTTASPA